MLVVRCLYSGLVGGLPFVARVALLTCVRALKFVVCAFDGFVLSFLLAYAFQTISSFCNRQPCYRTVGGNSCPYSNCIPLSFQLAAFVRSYFAFV